MPLKQLSLVKFLLIGALTGIIVSLCEFYSINPTIYYPKAYIIYISSLYVAVGILVGIIGYSKLKLSSLFLENGFPLLSPSLFFFTELSSIFFISLVIKIYGLSANTMGLSMVIFWIIFILLIYVLSFLLYAVLTKLRNVVDLSPFFKSSISLITMILFLSLMIVIYAFYPFSHSRSKSVGIEKKSVNPSIILIVVDTLRFDYVSGYGKTAATPEIEKILSDSILLENCYSSSPWTVPSHSTLFTSLMPSSHGADWIDEGRYDNSICMPLSEKRETLAEILKDRGYNTAAFVGNMTLAKSFGLSQGFEVYNDHPHPYYEGFILRPALLKIFYDNIRFKRLKKFIEGCDLFFIKAANTIYKEQFREFPLNYPNVLRRTKKRANEVNYEFFRWLEKDSEKPFFVFINYFEPHNPYIPPDAFLPELAKKYNGKVDNFSFPYGYACRFLNGEDVLSESDLEYIRTLYEGEVRFVDFNLGIVIKTLKEKGLYDNSLIIITSDHGEALGDHNFLTHENYLYDELIHVPFIVKLPENKSAGKRKHEITGLIDVAPSILKLLSIKGREQMQGRSDMFEPEDPGNEDEGFIFSEVKRTKRFIRCSDDFDRDLISLRNERWKIISSTKGNYEIFDMLNDPLELDNLENREIKTPDKLKKKLIEFFQKAEKPEEANISADKKSEIINKLRTLGYVQ